MTDEVLQDVRSNIGVSYAFYDEGAYRNELRNADMRLAPEALRVINLGRDRSLAPLEEVELGQYYGDDSSRTLRVVHNERILHPFQPYIKEATANQIEYFERVFSLETGLPSRNQTWYWKELLGAVSLIAALVALIPLSRILLEVPYFKPLVHAVPPALPRPQGRGRVLFWSLFTVAALVACFSYIPMAELSKNLFVSASTRQQTWFFPQRMNNAVMLWAILNGLLGFALFWLSYRFFGKQHGVEPGMWGAAISRPQLVRTLWLALTLFVCYFLLVFTVYFFFHVDYNFLFMGVRVFRPEMIILLCMYAPFFFIFFLSNSLRVNGAMRVEGDPEWKSMLLAGIANSLGLLLIGVVQYATFALTGTVHWTDGWLYVNLLFAVVPMVTCLIFVMVLISNTVFYLPL